MDQYNFNQSRTGAPYITLDQIEVLTENILNKYCPSVIDEFKNDDQVIRIMKNLMPNIKTGQWELEYLTDRANTILIDKQLDNPRDKGVRRFTLAHECCHGIVYPCVFYRGPN